MEGPEIEAARNRIQDLARDCFPEGAVREVTLLQYGDDPGVEPGEMVIRFRIPAGGPGEPGGPGGTGNEPPDRFMQAHRPAIERFRDEVHRELPGVRLLEFTPATESEHRFRMRMLVGPLPPDERPGDLTPVMARLGPTDLQTLDTLISTGIAANRADAVRWALARIRERPAYEELRERARQIEDLKTQF
ncbi:MAG TPA: hypothetical protein VMI33_24215 [Streptosporangiaceae bacterium]|nr:hypothetical protein [Streptosporangiaceae bacterium]